MSTVNPILDLVYTDVRSFVMAQLGLDSAHVVQGFVNRVAMPTGPFVVMQVIAASRLATNVDTWDETIPNPIDLSIEQSVRLSMQLDVYGPGSGDQAAILSTLLRDETACDAFTNSQPLHADEPVRVPLDDGEDQYEDRWTVLAQLQYNPVVSTPQQFADTLTATLIEIDEAYPP